MTESPQPVPRTSKLVAWGQLLRLPNLLTVPGDPIAGFFLAALAATSWPGRPVLRIGIAAGVRLLLYATGLLWNDYFDLAEDLRDRPSRPLPSGRVRPRTAAIVATVLLFVALAAARVAGKPASYVALAIAAAIIAYDAGGKRIPVIGPLLMGLCRGGSVLLGAAAFGADALANPLVYVGAATVTVYIASVAAIAARETRPGPLGRRVTLPAASLAFVFTLSISVLIGWPGDLGAWLSCALAVAAVLWAAGAGLALAGRPEPALIQKTVGRFIQGLFPIQAAWIALGPDPGVWVALAVLAAWPVCALTARRFYAS